MSVLDAQAMMNDFTTKLVISDLGHGNYRHQLMRLGYVMLCYIRLG
jgi:hypothetical protein